MIRALKSIISSFHRKPEPSLGQHIAGYIGPVSRPSPGMPDPTPDDTAMVAISMLPWHLSTAPGTMVWKVPVPQESMLLELAYQYDERDPKPILMQLVIEMSRDNLEQLLLAARQG